MGVGTTETDGSIWPDFSRLERQQCLVHATAVNLLHGIGENLFNKFNPQEDLLTTL